MSVTREQIIEVMDKAYEAGLFRARNRREAFGFAFDAIHPHAAVVDRSDVEQMVHAFYTQLGSDREDDDEAMREAIAAGDLTRLPKP